MEYWKALVLYLSAIKAATKDDPLGTLKAVPFTTSENLNGLIIFYPKSFATNLQPLGAITMNVESLNLQTSYGATTAHVARPQAKANAAVILIHEWWGINDHMRDIAGRYANEGYLCVAPDLFRGRVAKDPKEAEALMQALDIQDGVETIRKAIDETERIYEVQQFGITGYCMGGTFALRSACEISKLSAAAPFYGDISSENILQKLKVPTLFIAGNKDAWINPEKVNSLREAASKYNLPVEIVNYDADHAFFNNTRPEVYNPEAAADAWKRVLGFFRKHLLQSAARSA